MAHETDSSDLLVRVQALEATESLRRLVHEFSHGFDKRDVDRLLAVWHPEAVWVVAPGYEANGHDEIRAVAEQSWAQMISTHHWNCNHVFEVEGDGARGTVDVDAVVHAGDGNWHESPATYYDEYVWQDGGWLISRRHAVIHGTTSIGGGAADHPWGDIGGH